jgi:cytoskeleton protein RodZ
MSEDEQVPGVQLPSIGQILREARETQSLKTEDVAVRLRLMQRQIEAMESDDFEGLGQPVFARGFVRNYARLLGLAPDGLLARMEGLTAAPAPAVRHPEAPLHRFWWSSPWLILLLFVLLVLTVTPVAMYWWLNEGEDELISKIPSTEQIAPVTIAATETSRKSTEEAVQPARPVTDQADVSSPPASEPVSTVLADVPSGGVLRLEFGAESWVEIKAVDGRVLHSQLNLAGSSIDIRDQPPFDLVIGNAAQVRMTYNGRPVDLKPFTKVAVAKLRFEE